MFTLMNLPFKENALEPYISEKTISYHYGKHHKAYVDTVNQLIAGTEFQDMPLEEIIERTYDNVEYKKLYNNAGQVFNHNMYWNSVKIGTRFDDKMKEKIDSSFGSMNNLKEKLVNEVMACFGSGWVWLVENKNEKLEIITTANGNTPLVLGLKPILNIDVWEHAYYLDYQNNRKNYALAFIENLLGL